MLLDEARLAARIRHPNVVSTLDVVVEKGELLVVMDYVEGESLSRLARAAATREEPIPLGIVMSVIAGALYGLHAAHEATTEDGAPLCVIHRDVSPQNIMVGVDGVARVLDFGVARAVGRIQTTREGTLKGKLAYMSPEQVRGETLDRRSDLYAMGVVLWEMVAGRRLHVAETEAEMLNRVLTLEVPAPSTIVPGLPPALDRLVMRGLCPDRDDRFETALEMAEAAQRVAFATSGEVGAWVQTMGGDAITARNQRVARIESQSAARGSGGGAKDGSDEAPAPPARSGAAVGTVIARVAKGVFVPVAPSSRPLPLDPGSQVSAVSVSKSIPRSVPLGLGLAILGGSLFVGALVIALLTLKLRSTETTPASAAAADLPTASVAASPATTAPTSPPASASAVDPGPTPTASVTASPTSATTRAPTVRRPPPSRAVRCKPPYTIDANGIRSPKPECM
jgi:serine/threonine-protein kinase